MPEEGIRITVAFSLTSNAGGLIAPRWSARLSGDLVIQRAIAVFSAEHIRRDEPSVFVDLEERPVCRLNRDLVANDDAVEVDEQHGALLLTAHLVQGHVTCAAAHDVPVGSAVTIRPANYVDLVRPLIPDDHGFKEFHGLFPLCVQLIFPDLAGR